MVIRVVRRAEEGPQPVRDELGTPEDARLDAVAAVYLPAQALEAATKEIVRLRLALAHGEIIAEQEWQAASKAAVAAVTALLSPRAPTQQSAGRR